MNIFKNKVVQNASWIIVSKTVQAVLTLIINILTSRYLGPSNYGLVNYASSVTAFVFPIACLGLKHILVQETIQYPEEEGTIYGTTFILGTVSSVFCTIGVLAFVFVANAGDTETILVCALHSLVLFFQVLELIVFWFQARYLSKYSAFISLCAYIIVSVYKAFLLITKKTVYWFAVSQAIDYALIAVALIIVYRKLGGQKFRFSFPVAKRMFSQSRHYIFSSMMVTVFAQTDKIMLTLMLDEAVTGYYSAAVTCAGMTSFVFAAIVSSVRPAVFEAKKESTEKADKYMVMLYCIIIYLSLAQSIAMTLLAKPIILILYGADYVPAIAGLRIIVWYTTFSYIGFARNIWILSEQKQRYLWIINLSGASSL